MSHYQTEKEVEPSLSRKIYNGIGGFLVAIVGLLFMLVIGWIIGVNMLGLLITIVYIPVLMVIALFNLSEEIGGAVTIGIVALLVGGLVLWWTNKKGY